MPRIFKSSKYGCVVFPKYLAGYKAVIDAASEFGQSFSINDDICRNCAPAKVLVIGAGVAGLQAIATAKDLDQ